jgi:hypothetical protein
MDGESAYRRAKEDNTCCIQKRRKYATLPVAGFDFRTSIGGAEKILHALDRAATVSGHILVKSTIWF